DLHVVAGADAVDDAVAVDVVDLRPVVADDAVDMETAGGGRILGESGDGGEARDEGGQSNITHDFTPYLNWSPRERRGQRAAPGRGFMNAKETGFPVAKAL